MNIFKYLLSCIALLFFIATGVYANDSDKKKNYIKDGKKYLIVDWKTDWSDQYASKHRQQLELYKRLFSMSEGISMDNISVSIGYVGLKHKVHDGTISGRLDMAQPVGSAFNTIMKRVNLLLAWRQDVHRFFDDLKEARDDDSLKRSILEQYDKERQDL